MVSTPTPIRAYDNNCESFFEFLDKLEIAPKHSIIPFYCEAHAHIYLMVLNPKRFFYDPELNM